MRNTKRIKDLNADSRPYEKLRKYGKESLSDAELLAMILRTGSRELNSIELAQEILNKSNGSWNGLFHLTEEQLLEIHGIGHVKAMQIQCILEMSKRIARATHPQQVLMTTPEKVASYYMEELRHLETEVLMLACLNTKQRLICSLELSRGTVNSSILSIREMFVEALRHNAVNLILLHNHPSGDPTPSREDIVQTKRVAQAGRLLGIELVDHIIIGDNKYISLKEMGVLYE